MHATIFTRHGGAEVLTWVDDFARPQIRPGHALVKVHRTGVNRVDLVVRQGYPGLDLPLPHIPGGDVVGAIAELGADVEGYSVGQRVVVYPLQSCGVCALCRQGDPNLCLAWKNLGMHAHGGYAEYVLVPAASLVPLPDAVDDAQAVALPVAGLTAFHALVTVGQLQKGQRFFTWGGSGGVGTMAVQIARALGAKVAVTASSKDKVDKLRALGADLVLDRRQDDVVAAVRAFAPAGVDVALDFVGPETFATTFDLLKKGGTMLLCGMLTGRETSLNIHMTYLKHVSIKGLYMGTKDELATLVDWVASGRVQPVVDGPLPLAQAAQAHERMATGQVFGKLVLEV